MASTRCSGGTRQADTARRAVRRAHLDDAIRDRTGGGPPMLGDLPGGFGLDRTSHSRCGMALFGLGDFPNGWAERA